MAPHPEAFTPSDLERRLLTDASGKRRKDLPHGFDLKRDCPLRRMMQYDCYVQERRGKSEVVCEEVLRLFRRCRNGMTVETTLWDGDYEHRVTKD